MGGVKSFSVSLSLTHTHTHALSLSLLFLRDGNEYWLLFAQRRMPLTAQGLTLSLLNNPHTATSVNPQIIMRERTGLWYVHTGANISELVNSFSGTHVCEYLLRENLIESLHYTKLCLLSKYLIFKPMQQEWVERHAKAEMSMNDFSTIPSGLDTVSFMKRMEVI